MTGKSGAGLMWIGTAINCAVGVVQIAVFDYLVVQSLAENKANTCGALKLGQRRVQGLAANRRVGARGQSGECRWPDVLGVGSLGDPLAHQVDLGFVDPIEFVVQAALVEQDEAAFFGVFSNDP